MGGGGNPGADETGLHDDVPSLPYPMGAPNLRDSQVRRVETFTLRPVIGPLDLLPITRRLPENATTNCASRNAISACERRDANAVRQGCYGLRFSAGGILDNGSGVHHSVAYADLR